MLIGLTYDLKDDYLRAGLSREEVAEFDCAETIQALEDAIRAAGHATERIGNFKALVNAVASGRRWDLVFNIAEGVKGLAREAEVPALLEAYGIPHTFSGADLMALSLNKAATDAVVRAAGVPTADFFLVRDESDAARMPLPYPVFVKPVAEGTSKGIDAHSLVHNAGELRAQCAALLRRFRQPVLVETYLPGREFTVGILGSGKNARVLGVAEILLGEKAEQEAYTYSNKQLYEDRVRYALADAPEAADVALRAWAALDCLDAGRVDVRLDAAGRARFIEVNPLAGLNPDYSDLPILCRLAGFPYQELIGGILASAAARAGLR